MNLSTFIDVVDVATRLRRSRRSFSPIAEHDRDKVAYFRLVMNIKDIK